MNKYFIRYLAGGLFLLFLISCSVAETGKTKTGRAFAPPEAGNCASCHEGREVLNLDHVDTAGMTSNECSACHENLSEKIPLGHIHQLEGMSCSDCHEDPAAPEAVGSDLCKTCHNDMKALYNATSEVGLNPHFSPHEGKISDCNRCHHQHRESENYCDQCHKME